MGKASRCAYTRAMPPPLLESADGLTQWLLRQAVEGLPPLESASRLAERVRADPRHASHEARLEALVRREMAKTFTAGFVTGMAGLITLPVALPASLGATWVLQARMAAALASLWGHDLADPWVHSTVLLSLVGGGAPETLRRAGVRAGEWAATRLVGRLSEEALLGINRRVGFRLLTTASSRGAITLSRVVPVVGALTAGVVDAYGCRAVAKQANQLLKLPVQ
jgi:hypothetical protein